MPKMILGGVCKVSVYRFEQKYQNMAQLPAWRYYFAIAAVGHLRAGIISA